MPRCVNCTIAVDINQQYYYNATDMNPDIFSILEEWTGHEVSDIDRICQECFNLLTVEWNNRSEGNVGDRQLGHQSVCMGCGLSLSRQTGRISRRLQNGSPEFTYIANIANVYQVPGDASACNACWQRAHHHVMQQQREIQALLPESGSSSTLDPLSQPTSETHEIGSEASIHENINVSLEGYSRTPDTTNHCFVPECTNAERRRVPAYLRKKILIDCKIFITSNARVCAEHLSVYNFDFLNDYEFMTDFSRSHIVEMLNLLRNQKTSGLINFENIENSNETLCKYWTGLTVVQFLLVFNCLTELVNMCRKPKTALGLYLVRLRTGEPLRRIASLFCVSKSLLCMYIKKSRNCLLSQYLPLHLGINHISRENLSRKNLLIPRGLFESGINNPIVLFDGTYVYLQKSSNYFFQKKTYSLHKYSNLVKPFLIVSSDGYILDIFGPYAATTSDADIMKQLFQNHQSLVRQFFEPNDVFILDRGFRDAIDLLTSLGYRVYKPETLEQGETQLSTWKANKSRMVTLCRWVIEIVNGRFKRDFKLFRIKYFNLAARHLMDDFKIAGAFINNFHPAVTDRPDAQSILNRALSRINAPNHLSDFVAEHQLNRRRANFVLIDAQIPQLNMFPIMEMSDLILFSLGTYQIKQARSYYGEHIRANGTFVVEVSDEFNIVNIPGISSHETLLIRGRIRSRHQSSKIYYTYILLNTNEIGDWQDRICAYYCSCIIGKRTMGSCAHVMTLIWYLGWARHQDNISPPAPFLDNILVREDVENEEFE